MQYSLTIDISEQSAEASLCSVKHGIISVSASSRFDLPESFKGLGSTSANVTDETTTDPVGDLAALLKKIKSEFSEPWTTLSVVIPAKEKLSFNLALPFTDPRSINKVIDLEIQDVIPFEIDEFLVSHRVVGALPETSATPGALSDVHVCLIPKAFIRDILKAFRQAELEPALITTRSVCLGALFSLAKGYCKENSIILHVNEMGCSLAFSIGGIFRLEKTVLSSNLPDQSAIVLLLAEFRVAIAAIEKKYGVSFEMIYLYSSKVPVDAVQNVLGRPVEDFEPKEIMTYDSVATATIAPLSAAYVTEEAPLTPLVNFRVREFSFARRFQDIFKLFKPAAMFAVTTLVIFILALLTLYGIGQYRINAINRSIMAKVGQVIPDFTPQDGNIINSLREREVSLSDQLGALGSPSRVTPLDALAQISSDLKDQSITTQSIKIVGNRATVEGTAPDLSAVDRMEKSMRSNKRKTYSKVSSSTGAATGGKGYRFTLDILLAQE